MSAPLLVAVSILIQPETVMRLQEEDQILDLELLKSVVDWVLAPEQQQAPREVSSNHVKVKLSPPVTSSFYVGQEVQLIVQFGFQLGRRGYSRVARFSHGRRHLRSDEVFLLRLGLFILIQTETTSGSR